MKGRAVLIVFREPVVGANRQHREIAYTPESCTERFSSRLQRLTPVKGIEGIAQVVQSTRVVPREIYPSLLGRVILLSRIRR